MNKEIIKQIEILFFERLEEKTGWGKNDVKGLYKQCVLEILLNHIN